MQLTFELHVKMFVIFGLLSSILAHNSDLKLALKSIYVFNILCEKSNLILCMALLKLF
jgi:hypothetical protein